MPLSGPEFQIPKSLLWLNRREDGRDWLSSLPDLLAAAQSSFNLDLSGPSFSGGNVSYVLPAKKDGVDAVLKIAFIDRESRHEADALKLWNGNGAVKLLAHDAELGALLLERCRPGNLLAQASGIDQMEVLTGLLQKLLVPANTPFSSLASEAEIWAGTMHPDWIRAGKPCEQRLVDIAVEALKSLVQDQTEKVLLHQDLHGHNILSADRDAWLAIDPKPLSGDPAFCLSPIVRSSEFGHTKKAALYRLDRLSADLGLDRERARYWTIGQTMAWAFSSDQAYKHFDTARWLLGS